MPAVKAPPAQLKDWFDAARYRAIAQDLAALAPHFDRQKFLALTLGGLAARSLMERLRQCAIAIDAALPGTFREKLAVLRPLAPTIQHGFVAIVLCDFVAREGLDDFDASLDALRFFTRFGSAEFAVRPFLIRDQARTLTVMATWARDPDEHVRRLASEGCRPRLPWGQRLPALVRDPAPLAPILGALKDDASLYVRKSVANNLNDITKDHPDWVLARVESWDRSSPHIAWIAKRALRTLIKRGDARALALFGAGAKAAVRATLAIKPARLKLGESLTLTATITSTTPRAQRLVVDYVVHYARANGKTSAKVFKWSEFALAPRATAALTKRQTIRDFSTRRHFAGKHVVELQINGRRVARAAFQLRR
jgi:3-methyladenine DNA glycosylase AlkC